MSESNSEKANANVEIMGYSERGCLNAVLYEIRYHEKSLDILKELLNSIRFPFLSDGNEPKFNKITKAEIFIDQSFSQFGDADAVFMIEKRSGGKTIIFLEAKVKTDGKQYNIDTEFTKFKKFKECREKEEVDGYSSNLFTQLYYKYRMIESLTNEGLDGLQNGVEFVKYSPNKLIRKIGGNQVVLKAVGKLKKYLDGTDDKAEVYYVALIPDAKKVIGDFLKNNTDNLPYGDNQCIGYITWELIKYFCTDKKLYNAENVFEFNNGQIY